MSATQVQEEATIENEKMDNKIKSLKNTEQKKQQQKP